MGRFSKYPTISFATDIILFWRVAGTRVLTTGDTIVTTVITIVLVGVAVIIMVATLTRIALDYNFLGLFSCWDYMTSRTFPICGPAFIYLKFNGC
jgi:hypothetical protein